MVVALVRILQLSSLVVQLLVVRNRQICDDRPERWKWKQKERCVWEKKKRNVFCGKDGVF